MRLLRLRRWALGWLGRCLALGCRPVPCPLGGCHACRKPRWLPVPLRGRQSCPFCRLFCPACRRGRFRCMFQKPFRLGNPFWPHILQHGGSPRYALWLGNLSSSPIFRYQGQSLCHRRKIRFPCRPGNNGRFQPRKSSPGKALGSIFPCRPSHAGRLGMDNHRLLPGKEPFRFRFPKFLRAFLPKRKPSAYPAFPWAFPHFFHNYWL